MNAVIERWNKFKTTKLDRVRKWCRDQKLILRVALAVLVFGIGSLLFSWIIRGPSNEGLILLDTPQVFTRGRLVNDRTVESAWLVKQLDRTDDLISKERFGRARISDQGQNKVAIEVGASTASSKTPGTDETQKDRSEFKVSVSPLDEFDDAARYREAIRGFLMSTVLDDRHDIEGNALYRLNFNATVLPRKNSNLLAAVLVRLYEPRDDTRTRDGYVELVYDWGEKVQEQLSRVISDRSFSIEKGVALDLKESRALAEWLRRELQRQIAFFGNTVTPETLLREVSAPYLAQHSKSGLKGRQDSSNSQRENKQQDDRLTSPQFKVALAVLDALRVLEVSVDYLPDVLICTKTEKNFLDLMKTVVPIGSIPIGHKPSSCHTIGEEIYRKKRERFDLRVRRESILAEFSAEYVLNQPVKADLRELADPFTLAQVFEVRPWQLCEIGPCSPVVKPRPEYLTAGVPEVPVQHSILPDWLISGSRAASQQSASSSIPLRRLVDVLAGRTDAFTYSVVPNRDVERAQIARQNEAKVGAKLATGQLPTASLVSSVDSARSGLQRDPTIIGFGDWGGRFQKIKHDETKFGWVMFPLRHVDGFWQKRQTPEHYSISAMVSLPGWWRNVRLEVKPCWLSDDDLVSNVSLPSICGDENHSTIPPYHLDIRLPGDAEAIMQNLRFNVVRYPYLFRDPGSDQDPPTVEVGRPADLLIRGDRLWRSPIVKLGTQQTSLVEVLPDMHGIIAKFDCIWPSPGTAGMREEDSPDPNRDKVAKDSVHANGPERSSQENEVGPAIPLSVITSEGMTIPTKVLVRPFKRRIGESADNPCWPKQQKIANVPPTPAQR